MSSITDISLGECVDSKYVELKRMSYRQNNREKSWDIVNVHESVCILLYNTDKDAFILVKQFRPPVYLSNGDGFTYELCAGIVDKDMSLAKIASEEIEEECGYRVDDSRLEELNSFYSAVGFAGSPQTLFYASVSEEDKIHDGGGIDEENIEVVYIPINKAREFLQDSSYAKTPALMYAFMWYFEKVSNG